MSLGLRTLLQKKIGREEMAPVIAEPVTEVLKDSASYLAKSIDCFFAQERILASGLSLNAIVPK